MRLIATCPEETKHILANELETLGATNIEQGYRAVEFDVNEKDFYRVHLRCRTASQIHLIVKKIPARTRVILNSQAKRIKWEEVFSINKTYRIDAVAGDRGDDFMSSNEISKTVRLSLENRFQHKAGSVPKVDLKDPEVVIVVYVYKGKATVSVNTSGMTLHKRGYKNDKHPAPLKETLASSVLDLCDYDGTTPLYDPMCGSGTTVIEAAMKALDKGANIHRKKGKFGFEHLPLFNSALFRQIQDEVRAKKKEDLHAPIFASDISESFIHEAKDNALRARVEKHITFDVKSFFDTKAPATNGLLLCNPPYGERISGEDADEAETFFKKMGDHLKKEFPGWTAAIFVASDAPWKSIGLKTKKKFNLRNGSIPTKLLLFDIREGSFRKNEVL